MSKLYTPEMLALTTELAQFPLSGDFALRADARSDVCGSTIALGINIDTDGLISGIGLRVSACAVGQSSAAVMAGALKGSSPQSLREMLFTIERWVAGEGAIPDWPRFEILEPSLSHPGRHGALKLPWEAAHEALSSTLSSVQLSSDAAAR